MNPAEDDREWLELARGEQPRQLGVDAGEALLGVGGGVAGGAAEGRRGGESTLSVLGRGEAVAVSAWLRLGAAARRTSRR